MKRLLVASIVFWCVGGAPLSCIEPEIGLTAEERALVIQDLRGLLADHVVLSMAFLRAHWNVTGPLFGPLHELYEENYKALQGQIDDLAERIRMLGEKSPGTLQEFLELARIHEFSGFNPEDQGEMLYFLMEQYEEIIRALREAGERAREARDAASENFFAELLWHHEKAAWMLRAHLDAC